MTTPPAQWGPRSRSLDRDRPALAFRRARRAERARRLVRGWTYSAGWRACGRAVARAVEAQSDHPQAVADAATAREIGRHPR